MKTIIYAHPYEKSFNHAMLDRLTGYFDDIQQAYSVIDLYKDQFDPRFSGEELRGYSQGTTPYELVHKYQKILAQADELIIITPIWWYSLPAELKGFFDKVMLKGFAYTGNQELRGLLVNIQHATVITTSTVTKASLQHTGGDFIQGTLIDHIFADIGISPVKTDWLHFGEVNVTTDQARQQFLADLPARYENGKN